MHRNSAPVVYEHGNNSVFYRVVGPESPEGGGACMPPV